MDFIPPNHTSKCTWTPNASNSPHIQRTEIADRDKILPNVLHAIGQTPMVKLNTIPAIHGIKCEIFVKCEFMNPGGSVKDRIGYRMVEDAEEKGLLKPGYTIIEPTSGNTGIGLAMAAAVKGYRCIIVMPEKMSNEKECTLHALGAEIVRTPTEASWDSLDSNVSVAYKLQKEIPNSVILNQYTNPGNPLAHYDFTASEILKQCDGKVDYVIIGAGTGGTVTGISRKFKEVSPKTKIVGVDPNGSILAEPSELNKEGVAFYEVEGIGYDFIPTVLDRKGVDIWIKTDDNQSLNMARTLIHKEGLLCGASSGAAVTAAIKLAKDLPENKRIVVILPDGIRNYLTKFVSDQWMQVRGFLDLPCPREENLWWWNISVDNLSIGKPILKENTSCREAISILQDTKENVLVVTDDQVKVRGVISTGSLTKSLASGNVKLSDPAEKAMAKSFTRVKSSMTLGVLSRAIEKDSFAIVLDGKDKFLGVVTQFGFLNFINSDNGLPQSNGKNSA